jgi:hypothetical protein
MCSPGSKVLPFLGRGFVANTHTAVAWNAGAVGLCSPLWSFPAAPSCSTENFIVRSDARAHKVVPSYGALALSKPHRPQSRRPCWDRVVDPLALATVDLWCVPPSCLTLACHCRAGIPTKGHAFLYPNQTLGSPHLRRNACCRATVPRRSPSLVPSPSARHRFCVHAVATSPASCTCTHPRSQGPVFWAGTPG